MNLFRIFESTLKVPPHNLVDFRTDNIIVSAFNGNYCIHRFKTNLLSNKIKIKETMKLLLNEIKSIEILNNQKDIFYVVPNIYDENQYKAIKTATHSAGFNVIDIIPDLEAQLIHMRFSND